MLGRSAYVGVSRTRNSLKRKPVVPGTNAYESKVATHRKHRCHLASGLSPSEHSRHQRLRFGSSRSRSRLSGKATLECRRRGGFRFACLRSDNLGTQGASKDRHVWKVWIAVHFVRTARWRLHGNGQQGWLSNGHTPWSWNRRTSCCFAASCLTFAKHRGAG